MFAALSIVSRDRPSSGVSAANATYDGIRPSTISTIPNASPARITSRSRGRPTRRAPRSAPVSDPMARVEPSRPYSPGPFSKTWVAIRAEVIWKFMPNVPAKNTATRISLRSGRLRT